MNDTWVKKYLDAFRHFPIYGECRSCFGSVCQGKRQPIERFRSEICNGCFMFDRTHKNQIKSAFILVYKKIVGRCELCDLHFGEVHPFFFQFDHLDPIQKSESITSMIFGEWTLYQIACELMLCRILCKVCHKKHTRTQYPLFRSKEF
jgi:hypothetical protein